MKSMKFYSGVALLSMALLLAACGGGSGSGGDGAQIGSSSSSGSSSSGGSSSSSSSSGSSSSGGAGDTYAKAYQLGEEQLIGGRPLVALADGGMIYSGNSDNDDTFVARLDKDGNPKWVRYIESVDEYEFFSEAWVHASDELYLIGQMRHESWGGLGAGRLILDLETGDLKSSKYLKLADIQIYSIKPVDDNQDGAIDAVILVTQNHAQISDYFVVKVDLDLSIIWAKEISAPKAFAGDVVSTADGSVFMTAQIEDPEDYTRRKLYLIKFDRDGNLQFQKSMEFGEGVPRIDVYSIHAIPVGSASDEYRLILSGAAEFGVSEELDPDIWFMGIDGNGEVIWSSQIESEIPLLVFGARKNGRLLIGRHTDTHVYYGDIKFDGSISLLSVENTLEIEIDHMIELSDGGLALKVDTNRFDEEYVDIIAKIDSENNLPSLEIDLVAMAATIETLPIESSSKDEVFSVMNWAVEAPIDSERVNREVELYVTDLVIK
ncbi:hypothetical protein [Microbulbifer taiwanensis]|uniref:Uncharacterized protein n=1 Tax=Microbulbifer taiwanensis TaxID=986746 RepID=A0ABW1YKL2_9GAMM|nr:hypothetical protein [Microbulbifer taiwanensis]